MSETVYQELYEAQKANQQLNGSLQAVYAELRKAFDIPEGEQVSLQQLLDEAVATIKASRAPKEDAAPECAVAGEAKGEAEPYYK